MNIVIPTYNKHYQYNINFLDSFDLYCLDKKEVKINFIVSSLDYDLFNNFKEKYQELNINIFKLSDLIKIIDNATYDDSPNFFSSKYSIQSIKKLFAYSCVDTDYVVFDSENLCLKNFYFKSIFQKLKNKDILYCDNVYQEIQKEVISACNLINDFNFNKWCFLKSYWFYELDYVKELILEIKQIHKMDVTLVLKNKLFFEYQLYCNFLYKKNLKNFISSDQLLSENELNFKNLLDNNNNNLEYINLILTKENIGRYIGLIKKLDEKIIRLHWIDEELKNKIINETDIYVGTFHWDN